eukprot:718674-Prymnesium_polylepis.1
MAGDNSDYGPQPGSSEHDYLLGPLIDAMQGYPWLPVKTSHLWHWRVGIHNGTSSEAGSQRKRP